MRIKFWGTRGSIAVPGKQTIRYGGNTTCLEITLESGRVVIVDAGTGIRALGDKLASENEKVDIHLLVTHIHWDHVLGFPYFTPLYRSTSHILIDGYPTCVNGLRNTFDNKMGDGFFPVKFADLKAEIQYLEILQHRPLEIDGAVIEAIPLHHPQGGFGFRFREGEKTFVFLTDNELRKDGWKDRSFDDYAEFCRNADLLIHDAQYTPEEIEERRDWGHSDYLSAFDLAYTAGVKNLFLFHHDPSRTDAEVSEIQGKCEAFARNKKSTLIIDAAQEESEIML
jgi:phosphoribosyl 1,2-cyclic phosphodiesterase